MHPFRAFISLYTPISDKDWEVIQRCLEYKIIQQGRILLKQGSICRHLYFLENGHIKFYKVDGDFENIIHSVEPPSLFTAPQSFTTQNPSEYAIQAVEESYIWCIKREDVIKLKEISSWNKFISSF